MVHQSPQTREESYLIDDIIDDVCSINMGVSCSVFIVQEKLIGLKQEVRTSI